MSIIRNSSPSPRSCTRLPTLPGVRALGIDRSAIASYLCFQYVPTPQIDLQAARATCRPGLLPDEWEPDGKAITGSVILQLR